MKKTINGKRFDTEKAVLVGEANNVLYAKNGTTSTGLDVVEGIDDPRHWDAGLYMTPRSKEFFLAGKGGPMSRFGQAEGQNSWSHGEDIIPMTEKDALDFARWFFHPTIVERFFHI